MNASAALARNEMAPPAAAETPATRPHTAKQRIAATTVMATWPSTTLIASRRAWGNSRVTTTLLCKPTIRVQRARANRRHTLSDVRKLFWPATTYGALAKGRELYTPTSGPSTKKPRKSRYPSTVERAPASDRLAPRLPRLVSASPPPQVPNMLKVSLILLSVFATAGAAAAGSQSRAGESEFRGLYKELVETNTALSNGDCTLAAERVAVRLTPEGPEDLRVFTAPDHPTEGGLLAVYPGSDAR